jgi:hypothetical protein
MSTSTATDVPPEPAPHDGQAGQPSIVRIRPKDWSGEHKKYDPFIDNVYDYNVQYENFAANESAHMYDWLADTGSTNHISNRRELFSSYEPMLEATVHGVGSKITQVAGRGTINLIAKYGTRKRTLRLENVNHIPSNKYNIFALGRWDSQGWRYQASNGELKLFDRHDVPVLKGHKITTNIYKFQLTP